MQHLSVLFDESLQGLEIKPQGAYLDCTFGRGGHSKGILQKLGQQGRLLAIDRDLAAIQSDLANEFAKDTRFSLHHGCFSQLGDVVEQCDGIGQVDGVLMDLGVSSPQLDDALRGFSFMRDGPLDMRMDESKGLSAAQWLKQVNEAVLVKVLFEYGEERFARRIAAAIMERTARSPIETTRDLSLLIEQTIPKREKNKHPATRCFQAIRIEINNELEEIKQGLQQALDILKPGGRLVVISFHSLEDRIVKRFIRKETGRKFNPGRLPIKEDDIEQGILKKIGKVVRAGKQELDTNPRARSAIMRIAERV
ncbi:MAG: 16S rRNA (cytosine(1402)-N(4))-methyltransferase RsmH [Methylococcales symbiont of Iophon sp. n. MRB-2018]|nr:MAG: 16S rRNA (cytosine(1402)-N(4))-methyltransferase RsmH [Methylococcales symbiont of Iophon sp. n. MRB-2018]KAF3979385.1 MAG: 16S rRNA (cytosine(1402)-N(4))-methyltransferase RsmH [Methylococcales symbiont of Iophon sp. n. MRB-2018]